MASEIIINVAPEETRVAVLDRKILTDLYIDRVKQRDFVGNGLCRYRTGEGSLYACLRACRRGR